MHEIDLELVRRLQCFVALAAARARLLTVPVTSWKVTSVAPSGSGMVAQSTTLPSGRSSRPMTGSRFSIAVMVVRRLCQTVVAVERNVHWLSDAIWGRSASVSVQPHMRANRIEKT
jgi:hypothetical protein